jgi:hypothetical protein
MEKPPISPEVILQILRPALTARRERQQVAHLCIAEFREDEPGGGYWGLSIEICLSILRRSPRMTVVDHGLAWRHIFLTFQAH